MACWTASAKWAAGPALDGRRAMLLGLALTEVLGPAFGDAARTPPRHSDACLPPRCGSWHCGWRAKESDFVFVFMCSATGYANHRDWASGLTFADHGAPFICFRRTAQSLNRLQPPPSTLAS